MLIRNKRTKYERRIPTDLAEQEDVAKRPRIEAPFVATLSPVLGISYSSLTAFLSSTSSNIVPSTPRKVQSETSAASSLHPTLQLKPVMRELQVPWLPSSYNGPVKQEKGICQRIYNPLEKCWSVEHTSKLHVLLGIIVLFASI